MSSRCSRRKCQPSGPRWGELLPLQPDNKDLIQLALLHWWAACSMLAVMEQAVDTAELTLSRTLSETTSFALRSAPSILLTLSYSHKVDSTYYSHLTHWVVQTLNSANIAPTHTLTLTTLISVHHLAPSNMLTPNLFFPFCYFVFFALYAFLCHSLTPHRVLSLQHFCTLARTVWSVTPYPYFQPTVPWFPVGCCPVGIWCMLAEPCPLGSPKGQLGKELITNTSPGHVKSAVPHCFLGVVREVMLLITISWSQAAVPNSEVFRSTTHIE